MALGRLQVDGQETYTCNMCWAHSVAIGQKRQTAVMHTQSSMDPVDDHEPRKRHAAKTLALSSK